MRVEVDGPGLSVLTSLLSGFRGRKAILNHVSALVALLLVYVHGGEMAY